VLGVWWKRATKSGAIAGMVGGLVSGTWYLIYVTPAFMGQPIPSWAPGIDSLRFGIVGATVSLVAMVVVSLLTKPEKQAIQDMVDECRIPSGKVIIKHS
jgi:cation/acetate symporter